MLPKTYMRVNGVSEFGRMCNELASQTREDVRKVFSSEVKQVFNGAINRTKIAQRGNIRKRFTKEIKTIGSNFHDSSTAITLRAPNLDFTALTYITDDLTHKQYAGWWKLPDELWTRVTKARANRAIAMHEPEKRLQTRLDAIGLAKQSFLRIAKPFNLYDPEKIKFLSVVEKAKHPKARFESSIKSLKGEDVFGWEFINGDGWALDHGGARMAWEVSIENRMKYFEHNMNKGVFGSMKSIQSKYKGIWVR